MREGATFSKTNSRSEASGFGRISRIAPRRRELKPDTKGRYRPYLGFRLDADGNRKECRFHLGTDKKEAERRMERLYDLHDESEAAAGEPTWTGFALYAAKLIAKGTFTIP